MFLHGFFRKRIVSQINIVFFLITLSVLFFSFVVSIANSSVSVLLSLTVHAVALFSFTVIFYYCSKTILEPLNRISKCMEHLEKGKLDKRLDAGKQCGNLIDIGARKV